MQDGRTYYGLCCDAVQALVKFGSIAVAKRTIWTCFLATLSCERCMWIVNEFQPGGFERPAMCVAVPTWNTRRCPCTPSATFPYLNIRIARSSAQQSHAWRGMVPVPTIHFLSSSNSNKSHRQRGLYAQPKLKQLEYTKHALQTYLASVSPAYCSNHVVFVHRKRRVSTAFDFYVMITTCRRRDGHIFA
jgi:hypothetical protein